MLKIVAVAPEILPVIPAAEEDITKLFSVTFMPSVFPFKTPPAIGITIPFATNEYP